MLKLERLLGLIVCGYAIALSFRITITYAFFIAGLVVWLLWKIVRFRAGLKGFAFGPLTVPLLFYAAVVTISGIGGGGELGPVSGKEVFASVGTLRAFTVYFWAFDVFKNCPQYRVPAVLSMLVVSGMAGVAATVQQLCHWHPWSGPFLQGTGFLSEPMAFSGVMQIFSLLAVGIWFAGGYLRFPKPFNKSAVFLLLVLCNVAGLIFASERSAWLGFGVGLLLSTMLISARLVAISFGALLCGGLGAWLFIPVIKQRLESVFSGQADAGLTSRQEIWHRAYTEFLKSPVTGIGTTKFPHIEIPGATGVGKPYLAHAHSNVMQMLSTAGILGLCSYIWIVVQSILACLQHFVRNTGGNAWLNFRQRGERGIATGLLAAVISLTVAGLAEYNFGTGQVRLALWFALALLSSEA